MKILNQREISENSGVFGSISVETLQYITRVMDDLLEDILRQSEIFRVSHCITER